MIYIIVIDLLSFFHFEIPFTVRDSNLSLMKSLILEGPSSPSSHQSSLLTFSKEQGPIF